MDATKKFLAGVSIAALCYPLTKKIFRPAYYQPYTSEDKTVIVTGSTGNLGKALTFQLAARRARVIMAARDMEKCKVIRRQIVMTTGNKSLACRYLDLEDIDSINEFVDNITQTEPHIDVLINNAGAGNSVEKELTKYGIERNFWVNFVGPYLLTLRLLDKLEETSKSTLDTRIINNTSSPEKSWKVYLDDFNFDERKYDPSDAFRQSKLALAYFTFALDKLMREKKKNIFVFGFNPGVKRVSKSLYRPVGSKEIYESYIGQYYRTNVDRIVSPAVKAALSRDIKQVKTGAYFGALLTTWNYNSVVRDETKANLVWNLAANILIIAPSLIENQKKKSLEKSEEPDKSEK